MLTCLQQSKEACSFASQLKWFSEWLPFLPPNSLWCNYYIIGCALSLESTVKLSLNRMYDNCFGYLTRQNSKSQQAVSSVAYSTCFDGIGNALTTMKMESPWFALPMTTMTTYKHMYTHMWNTSLRKLYFKLSLKLVTCIVLSTHLSGSLGMSVENSLHHKMQ